jgi:ABC-type transport system involved in multi-copper enzyme maturation permease subunit
MKPVSLFSVIRSEFLKLRTLRSTWLSFAFTAIATIGFGALISYLSKMQYSKMSIIDRATFDPIQISLVGTLFAQFAVGVIGALMITSEFSSGSIRTTLAAVPSRSRVFVAKAAVLKLSVLVVGMASTFSAFLVGQAIMSGSGLPTATLADGGTLRAVCLAGLYLVLLTLIGFGLGLIIRQTAGTISVFVSILLVLPLITILLPSAWRDAILKFLPSSLGRAMMSNTTVTADGMHIFTPWVATGVLISYVVVLTGIGAYLFSKRDV